MTTPSLRHCFRPAYLDVFNSPRESCQGYHPRYHPQSSDLTDLTYSSTESKDVSVLRLDSTAMNPIRPLTPVCEGEAERTKSGDDPTSILPVAVSNSLKSRFRLRNFSLQRRSYPKLSRRDSSRSTSGDSTSKAGNVASILQGERYSKSTVKPLPPLHTRALPPPVETMELGCYRCYYFAARNCKGWTMGGSSNDACETCLASGLATCASNKVNANMIQSASRLPRCSLRAPLLSTTLFSFSYVHLNGINRAFSKSRFFALLKYHERPQCQKSTLICDFLALNCIPFSIYPDRCSPTFRHHEQAPHDLR